MSNGAGSRSALTTSFEGERKSVRYAGHGAQQQHVSKSAPTFLFPQTLQHAAEHPSVSPPWNNQQSAQQAPASRYSAPAPAPAHTRPQQIYTNLQGLGHATMSPTGKHLLPPLATPSSSSAQASPTGMGHMQHSSQAHMGLSQRTDQSSRQSSQSYLDEIQPINEQV